MTESKRNREFLRRHEVEAIAVALSVPRFNRYLLESGQDGRGALALYRWNCEVSSAFLLPLQLCEVITRNGVAEAIEAVYGAGWPQHQGFLHSLPDPARGYSPKSDLQAVRRRHATDGQVVANLSFVFWESMFTSRHDDRIWHRQLRRGFPFVPAGMPTSEERSLLHSQLGKIRKLRNRIAHHEPVFTRKLCDDYARVLAIVRLRCPSAAHWLRQVSPLGSILDRRP